MIYTIKDEDTIQADGRDVPIRATEAVRPTPEERAALIRDAQNVRYERCPTCKAPRGAIGCSACSGQRASNEKPRSNLVPMRPGTAHVIRRGGMSGQFTAGSSLATSPRAIIVCSHVDCAGKVWQTPDYLEADHRKVKQPHAWGWFHEGKLYAPGEVEKPKAPTFRIETAETAPDHVKAQAREVEKIMQREVERIHADPHAERRTREAPLVALVANAPEGLDANGWRAAVLAVVEALRMGAMHTRRPADVLDVFAEWLPLRLAGQKAPPNSGAPYDLGEMAYRRAVAPQGPRPKPERKGSTWRERGPRLVCDHGED